MKIEKAQTLALLLAPLLNRTLVPSLREPSSKKWSDKQSQIFLGVLPKSRSVWSVIIT